MQQTQLELSAPGVCQSKCLQMSALCVHRVVTHWLTLCIVFCHSNKQLVTEALRQVLGTASILWRPSVSMLREEGIELPAQLPEADAAKQQVICQPACRLSIDAGPTGHVLPIGGSDNVRALGMQAVQMVESGVRYLADPAGQKTGVQPLL